MSRRVELLAPAGNPEGFYGAIHAGADAVYLGGKRFGARAYADNFTTEELIACIRYAHLWGRRVYLTVNTLVKESEFAELSPWLQPLYEAGLDGVIVQDIGVLCFIREHFPDMELHVSTQMTLTGKYGARLLKEMGAVRIVPARELSLAEIRELKKEAGLEVETFIHGAMCYCYSGQCLFSSILGGRSGNRGRCAQPCRLPYQVEQSGEITKACYPLSLKDMCTIEHIHDLIEAGIDSFKIEGRMKKPEYTAGVTAIYREYIDRYYAGESRRVDWQDLQALSRLYIRSERQNGYYFKRNGRDMVTLDSPSYGSEGSEELLEQIRESFLSDYPRMEIAMEADFSVGKPAKLTCILNPPHGEEMQVTMEGELVSPAEKQPVTEENIRRQLGKLGDTVFRAQRLQIHLEDGVFYPLGAINELRRQAVTKLEDALILHNQFPVCRDMEAMDSCAKSGHLAMTGYGHASPDTVEAAHVSEAVGDDEPQDSHRADIRYHVSLRTEEQLNALVEAISGAPVPPELVYLDANLVYKAFVCWDGLLESRIRQLERYGCHMAIALPPILRSRDEQFLEAMWKVYTRNSDLFFGFLARSMDGLGFLWEMIRERAFDEFGVAVVPPAVYTDAGLYIWNRESLRCLSGINGFCMPYELRAAEQWALLKGCDIPCEKIVYGRIPLMLAANCITNTTEGCRKGQGKDVSFLIDRYQKRFPVVRDCEHCTNIIYNSLPLSLHGELHKWAGKVDFRLDFTVEDGQETDRVLQYFMSGAEGNPPFGEYTTGHEKRGAE